MPLVLPGAQHGLRRQINRTAARKGVKLRVEVELPVGVGSADLRNDDGRAFRFERLHFQEPVAPGVKLLI